MRNNNKHRLLIFTILPIGLLLFLFSNWKAGRGSLDKESNPSIENITSGSDELRVANDKHKGAHVFGRLDSTNFQFLRRNNIEWVTLVPWGVQSDFDSPIMNHHNGDSIDIIRSDSNWLSRLELVHAAGFKIFVKPHVWIHDPSDGKWRSDIFPTSEENWETWKKSYREFILRYANLAQLANAEMFCVGMELSRLSLEKPEFWTELIKEVRQIYSGKVTYAANWYNEYEEVTFWEDLDYIGVQAYFPLVKNEFPSTTQISKGWKKYLPILKSMHDKYNRKILFTELGYKSTADSAIEPWGWVEYSSDQIEPNSMETQANCYKAFFNTVWKENWFEGVHIWQLRSDYLERPGKKDDLDFTPLGKPAEKVIAKGFK